jgi:hypothetical protein
MARVSELMIDNPQMQSYAELKRAVVAAAQAGEIHLFMDIKPEFADTPRFWERDLEITFQHVEPARHDRL